jgi:hypothetical protein
MKRWDDPLTSLTVAKPKSADWKPEPFGQGEMSKKAKKKKKVD